MNRSHRIAISLFASAIALSAHAEGVHLPNVVPLTLEDAVRLGLQQNRGLRGAILSLEKAKAIVAETSAATKPTVGVGGQFTEFDKKNEVDFGKLMGQSTPLPLTIANRSNPAYFASLNLPIDVSGVIRSMRSQAHYAAIAAKFQVTTARNDVELSIRTAYLNALRAHSMRQVAADNLENAKTRKNDAESAFRAGASAKFDVISAERDLAEAESQSVSARTAEALALSGLNRAMGMDPMAVIVMPASLPNSTGDSLPKANPTDGLSENVESPFRYDADFDSALERSLKNRPEVHQAEAMVEAGRRGIEVAQRTIKPGLSVGYSYTYQPNAGLFTLEKVGAFSVSLNIPLYDGGVAKAKVSQAKADRDQAKLQLDEMKDAIRAEVQNAVLSLQQSEQRQRFAQAGLEQAKEAFRLARQRYQVGASTQVDVSSAQAALALANANVIQANIDRQMALAMYDHALGRSLTTP